MSIIVRIKKDLHYAMKMEVEYNKDKNKFNLRSDVNIESMLALKSVCRAIISMFPSIGIKPDQASDEDVIKLVRKFISQEKERMLYQEKYITELDVLDITPKQLRKLINDKIIEFNNKLTSFEIKMAERYLPKQLNEDDIKKWVLENIDFTKLKNKNQAIGIVMKQFKGQINGSIVNKIVNEL